LPVALPEVYKYY